MSLMKVGSPWTTRSARLSFGTVELWNDLRKCMYFTWVCKIDKVVKNLPVLDRPIGDRRVGEHEPDDASDDCEAVEDRVVCEEARVEHEAADVGEDLCDASETKKTYI